MTGFLLSYCNFMPIKIIDLFAGPGGLGEGFSAFRNSAGDNPFRIKLSIEKEASAHQTLLLRAFYRQFTPGNIPSEYYDYLSGKLGKTPEDQLYNINRYRKQIAKAREEARQLTLGENNRSINRAIENALGKRPGNWVLLGGPPCQAYSLVGRSRNRGIKGYKAENDHRNFLYQEYLKVISRFQPAVFIMENVKGLLSAKVENKPIFPKIHEDLQCPARALQSKDRRTEYEIFSLVDYDSNQSFFSDKFDPYKYVIKSENHGIPQARHRVILLGIRKDILSKYEGQLLAKHKPPSTGEVLDDLPPLRSGISKIIDNHQNWSNAIQQDIDKIISAVESCGLKKVAYHMRKSVKIIQKTEFTRGSNWNNNLKSKIEIPGHILLEEWYKDESGWEGVCNHESRSHIASDLHRYLFCAAYGKAFGRESGSWSPKANEFPKILAPKHSNWNTGKFSDRFRVQAKQRVATTITSHISKDGHYFIHYDPVQCRSFTVREAARIQTFPDNYFFVGNRTQQYVQVGNAVPPFLARQIADIVYKLVV